VELAHRIARNAPLSIAAVKRAVNERTAYGDQDAFRQQDQLVAPVLASHDDRKEHTPSPRSAHPTGNATDRSPRERASWSAHPQSARIQRGTRTAYSARSPRMRWTI
jgi:hypothetical protein